MPNPLLPLAAILFLAGLAAIAQAANPTASLTLQNSQFDPSEITVPAGQKIDLHVKNAGRAPAEVESSDLHVEKIVPAGQQVTLHVGPLQPGTYEFYDDFHPSTRGHLVAR